eukprot:1639677-Rhodomonas_salina.7
MRGPALMLFIHASCKLTAFCACERAKSGTAVEYGGVCCAKTGAESWHRVSRCMPGGGVRRAVVPGRLSINSLGMLEM